MIIKNDWLYHKFKEISQQLIIGKSQTCQDEFALELFKPLENKRYLDIGSGCPNCMSNTLLLEQNGWHGTCFDYKNFVGYKERKCNFIQADTTTYNFDSNEEYEYVSIDTDENTNASIKNLLRANIKPQFVTVEHDLYCVGEDRKNEQAPLMKEWGGVVLFSDVQHKDDISVIYEDWYIFEDNISDEILIQIDKLKKLNVFGSGFRTGQQCLWLLKLANSIY